MMNDITEDKFWKIMSQDKFIEFNRIIEGDCYNIVVYNVFPSKIEIHVIPFISEIDYLQIHGFSHKNIMKTRRNMDIAEINDPEIRKEMFDAMNEYIEEFENNNWPDIRLFIGSNKRFLACDHIYY